MSGAEPCETKVLLVAQQDAGPRFYSGLRQHVVERHDLVAALVTWGVRMLGEGCEEGEQDGEGSCKTEQEEAIIKHEKGKKEKQKRAKTIFVF